MGERPLLRVFVAAPFARVVEVCTAHHLLNETGFCPVGSWVLVAVRALRDRKFDLDGPGGELADMAEQNDRDIDSAHVFLALAYPGEGGEMFREFGYALTRGKPVISVGRPILSSYRPKVLRCGSMPAAIEALAGYARSLRPGGLLFDLRALGCV